MSKHNAVSAREISLARIKSFVGDFEGRLSALFPYDESNNCQRIANDPTICLRLRQAIVADKSLSLFAQNIEIAVGPRGVTLCGSVKSQTEREKVESDAAAVTKGTTVMNKLVVRSSRNPGTKSSRYHHANGESGTEQEQECDRIRRKWGIQGRSEFQNLHRRMGPSKASAL